MIILFILGLLLGVFAVFFALQNVAIVTVTFFSWQLTASLSIVILLAVFLGILIAVFLFLPESISKYFAYRKLKKENSKLNDELKKQKVLTIFAKTTAPTHEELRKIADGEIIHPEV